MFGLRPIAFRFAGGGVLTFFQLWLVFATAVDKAVVLNPPWSLRWPVCHTAAGPDRPAVGLIRSEPSVIQPAAGIL